MVYHKLIRRAFADIEFLAQKLNKWAPSDVAVFYSLTKDKNPRVIDPNKFLSEQAKTDIRTILDDKKSPVDLFCILSDTDPNSPYKIDSSVSAKAFAEETKNKIIKTSPGAFEKDFYMYFVDKRILTKTGTPDFELDNKFFENKWVREVKRLLNNGDYDQAFINLHMNLERRGRRWKYLPLILLIAAIAYSFVDVKIIIKSRKELAKDLKADFDKFTKCLAAQHTYEEFINNNCLICFEPLDDKSDQFLKQNPVPLVKNGKCTHKLHKACARRYIIMVNECVFCNNKMINLFNREKVLSFMTEMQFQIHRYGFSEEEYIKIINSKPDDDFEWLAEAPNKENGAKTAPDKI